MGVALIRVTLDHDTIEGGVHRGGWARLLDRPDIGQQEREAVHGQHHGRVPLRPPPPGGVRDERLVLVEARELTCTSP
ncbi:hypothetical protein [Nonomuraea turcica]|uniref:hypothetical protein n=1 Tax=Nonomuraea sp. G32 TaxID=3067274 RepID=UPI00273AF95D|nr:hypothetical protein [Nonomuraea sp. G32]MDP4509358.1 hypothetical protein [Nonomuraea sp. G32]